MSVFMTRARVLVLLQPTTLWECRHRILKSLEIYEQINTPV